MKKLKWKKNFLSDKSGCWYEMVVPSINWTYVVDSLYGNDNLYQCYLFINSFADETLITKKKFKDVEKAQKCCEEHLYKTMTDLNKFLKTK